VEEEEEAAQEERAEDEAAMAVAKRKAAAEAEASAKKQKTTQEERVGDAPSLNEAAADSEEEAVVAGAAMEAGTVVMDNTGTRGVIQSHRQTRSGDVYKVLFEGEACARELRGLFLKITTGSAEEAAGAGAVEAPAEVEAPAAAVVAPPPLLSRKADVGGGDEGLPMMHEGHPNLARRYVCAEFDRSQQYPRFAAVAADPAWDPVNMSVYVKESDTSEWVKCHSMKDTVSQRPGVVGGASPTSTTFRDDGACGFRVLDPACAVPDAASIGKPGGKVDCGLRIALLDRVEMGDDAASRLDAHCDGLEKLEEVRFAPMKLHHNLFSSFAMKVDGAWKRYAPTELQSSRPPADAANVHVRHLVLYGEPGADGRLRAQAYFAPRLMAKLALNWILDEYGGGHVSNSLVETQWYDKRL